MQAANSCALQRWCCRPHRWAEQLVTVTMHPCCLAGRSSWSRANVAGFVRIPDVTDAEAKAYLQVCGVTHVPVLSWLRLIIEKPGHLQYSPWSFIPNS